MDSLTAAVMVSVEVKETFCLAVQISYKVPMKSKDS